MPRGKPAIQNYSPELFELFAKASVEPVKIECGLQRHAMRLRFRLYNLRTQMRAEQHALAQAAGQVSLKIYKDADDVWWLEAYPGDSDELLDAIRAAGITVGDSGADDADVGEDESLDALLGQLTEDKT